MGITVRFHFLHGRMAGTGKAGHTQCWHRHRGSGTPYPAGEHVERCSCSPKQLATPQTVAPTVII